MWLHGTVFMGFTIKSWQMGQSMLLKERRQEEPGEVNCCAILGAKPMLLLFAYCFEEVLMLP